LPKFLLRENFLSVPELKAVPLSGLSKRRPYGDICLYKLAGMDFLGRIYHLSITQMSILFGGIEK
jgi:hypothetical protein